MILGLNSNIRHEGKIFHIQTEDSGARYGHVISHLFLDGVILASVKTPYPQLLELAEEEREKEVIELMRRSHRTMIRSLTSGGYQKQVETVATEGTAPAQSGPDAEPVSSPSETSEEVPAALETTPAAPAQAASVSTRLATREEALVPEAAIEAEPAPSPDAAAATPASETPAETEDPYSPERIREKLAAGPAATEPLPSVRERILQLLNPNRDSA